MDDIKRMRGLFLLAAYSLIVAFSVPQTVSTVFPDNAETINFFIIVCAGLGLVIAVTGLVYFAQKK